MAKKVLHNFATLNLGGAESRILDIMREIDRNEFHFDFVVYDEKLQYFEEEVLSLGGRVHRIPSPRKNLLRHLLALYTLIHKEGYDVLHSHTSYHSGLVSFVGWARKVPVRVAHARTTGSLSTSGALGTINSVLGRILIRIFATHLLAISDEAGRFVFGNSAHFQILPNAFSLSDYIGLMSSQDARNAVGLPQRRLILGQIGRLEEVKNHQFSLRLLKEIKKSHPEAILVFVGDGDERTELARLASNLELDDSVIFAGVQANVPIWMKAFDVTLLPSLYEGLGTVSLESQAAGTPILASTGVPRSIDLGVSLARFLPLNAPLSLWVDKILELLDMDPPGDEKILRAFNEHNYTLDVAIEKFSGIYRGDEAH